MAKAILSSLAHQLGLLGDPKKEKSYAISAMVTDSRQAIQDSLFFALAGERTNGHCYLQDAAARGAKAAVVDQSYHGENHGMTLLPVPNVLVALQNLAQQRLQSWKPQIVAVTGSVGKTTTKEFISILLSSQFKIGKTLGNANSQVGLPLTILNLQGDEEVLVLEMAMTHPGQIARLVEIAPPTLAVITKIGSSHAGNFVDGLMGVAQAKAEIFSNPQTKKGILGYETRQVPRFQVPCVVASCSPQPGDYQLCRIEKLAYVLELGGKSPSFQVPNLPQHFFEDLAIAIAVCREMGLSWKKIIEQLPSVASLEGRFKEHWVDGALFINDSYNASPEAIRAALDNLPHPHQKGGRKIGVFGGMAHDLGASSLQWHVQVAEYALEKCDLFFCFGPGSLPMKEIFEREGRLVLYAETMQELQKGVFSFIRSGDVILLKAANRYGLWQLLAGEEMT